MLDTLQQETGNNTLFIATYRDLKEAMYEVLAELLAEKELRDKDDKLYTPTEFAEKHSVTKMTLNRWVKAGILKQTRYGGKVYYKESDLKEG